MRLSTIVLFPLSNLLHNVPIRDTGNNTTTTDRTGVIWAPNGRTTSSLLQSCVLTLLSCTWVVLHLNIPAPFEGRWALIKRKLKWMIITLVAPEITCSVVLRQWGESRAAMREMKKLSVSWTMVQGFYATMGGYVLHHRGTCVPLLNSEIISLLDDPHMEPPFQLPSIDERDIEDRSKTSGFTKFVTLVQTGWLVAQCIIRGVENLPVSQLEIATVAFATCTLIANGFWWKKPLDVKTTTAIRYDGELPAWLSCENKGWRDRQAMQRVKMTTHIITRGSQKSMFFNLVLPLFFFSTIFSSIHLVAWNFDFKTPTERSMWRICSLTATLTPLVIAGSLQVASIWDPSTHKDIRDARPAPEFAALVILCYFISVLAYVAARLVLIFQVFYCLRSMPIGIYSSITWIDYFPHL